MIIDDFDEYDWKMLHECADGKMSSGDASLMAPIYAEIIVELMAELARRDEQAKVEEALEGLRRLQTEASQRAHQDADARRKRYMESWE